MNIRRMGKVKLLFREWNNWGLRYLATYGNGSFDTVANNTIYVKSITKTLQVLKSVVSSWRCSRNKVQIQYRYKNRWGRKSTLLTKMDKITQEINNISAQCIFNLESHWVVNLPTEFEYGIWMMVDYLKNSCTFLA